MPVMEVAVFVALPAVNTQILHMGFRNAGMFVRTAVVADGWKCVFGTGVALSVSRGIAVHPDQRRRRRRRRRHVCRFAMRRTAGRGMVAAGRVLPVASGLVAARRTAAS